MEKQYRSAHFVPESVDREGLTAQVVWGTSQAVERRGYKEILSFENSHVKLERLNAGGPLLMGHKADSQIGVVERAWVEDGEGKALVRFSKRPEVRGVFEDVADGILRNVSVGYVVKRLEKDDQDKTFRAVDWEPFEISLVPIPADHKAQIREYEEPKNISFEIVTEEKEMDMKALEEQKTLEFFQNSRIHRCSSEYSSPNLKLCLRIFFLRALSPRRFAKNLFRRKKNRRLFFSWFLKKNYEIFVLTTRYLRLLLKPLMSVLFFIADETHNLRMHEFLIDIEESKSYKFILWLLDYLESIDF